MINLSNFKSSANINILYGRVSSDERDLLFLKKLLWQKGPALKLPSNTLCFCSSPQKEVEYTIPNSEEITATFDHTIEDLNNQNQ